MSKHIPDRYTKNLLRENSNSYMPAFFYMNLKFPFYDSPVVLYNLPKSDLAAFVHEYVHFIQDITTYWGLNNAYVYSEYIHGAVNQIYQYPKGSFCVPFRISNNSNNIELNQAFINKCIGNYDNMDSLFITNIEVTKENVKFNSTYLKELEHVYLKLPRRKIQFGARAIMESMAYLLEKQIASGGSGVYEYPYCSAEFIVLKEYPEFAKSTLNILALCDLSLQFSNPAAVFIKTLLKFKREHYVPNKATELYEYFYSMPCVQIGKECSFTESLFNLGQVVRERLKAYLDHPVFDSFHRIVDNLIICGLDYRINNPTFILDIAESGHVLYNNPMRILFNRIGTPIIKDCNEEYLVINPSFISNDELQYFPAIEQILNLFTEGHDCCDMLCWCQQSIHNNVIVDDRCINTPWERCADNNLCPYATLWKHWNLSGYTPKKN